MKKHYVLLLVILLNFSVAAQIVTIPDANFKNKLISAGIDTNANGEIEVTEALNVTNLNVSNASIVSLEGIQSFTNLEKLDCKNNNIATLDVTPLPNLVELDCSHNQLTSLQINAAPTVQGEVQYILDCSYNFLTELSVGTNHYDTVNCQNNQIVNLNLSETTFLYEGNFQNNLLTSFIYPAGLQMGMLYLSGNPLTSFAIPPIGFDTLYIQETQLVNLDLSNLQTTSNLYIIDNPLLESINIRNSNWEGFLTDLFVSINNNPALQYVCVNGGTNVFDENGSPITNSEFVTISEMVPSNVVVTPYCNFEPSWPHNSITGNVSFDCAASNLSMQGVKILMDGVNNSDSFLFTDQNGNYQAYHFASAVTLTPEIEMPQYFTTSPASATYNFTTTGNNEVANFCINTNGFYPDLEISIVPTSPARPGFDAHYNLLLKNKGTEIQSGTVNVNFDDTLLDFVAANPSVDSQAINNLSWNFNSLMQFETRIIEFTLNVNSPMETPAVSIGDTLSLTASISTGETDTTPEDNTSTFNQIVVGSFDPNDKSVQEPQIDITNIGDYLHYFIRFQNTGTFAAENVVVLDMLATNLDRSTVEITSVSHPYTSTLTVGNKLEFFFENINLPPSGTDEPGSHGYVAFKVKPASTVAVGSIIENKAEIYFDYNFPIVTNTVSTTVTTLGNQQFDLNDSFNLHPNPASDIVNIKMTTTSNVTSINIYNTLGQLVKSFPAADVSKNVALDVADLKSGSYFIQILSATGKSVKKLIKL